jgi:hypothetical protein
VRLDDGKSRTYLCDKTIEIGLQGFNRSGAESLARHERFHSHLVEWFQTCLDAGVDLLGMH